MIEIRYLQAESGANKSGTCNCCGKSSSEDPLMISVKFSHYGHGTLICLCDDCKKKLMEALLPANISEIPNSYNTISRAKAIDALRTMQTYKLFAGDDMLLIDQAGAQTELMMLPPVQPAPSQVAKDIARIVENGKDMRVIGQPERIRGHWICDRSWSEGVGMGESYGHYWKCDKCGHLEQGDWGECGCNFCSNCGSDNREVTT